MTRSFFGILTIFSFLWIQVYNSAVMTVYELDKTSYIEFCENKAEPELNCNGKCHLSKQLIDQTETSHPGEPPVLAPEQVLFPVTSVDIEFNQNRHRKDNFPLMEELYALELNILIDHPPKV